MVQYVNNSGWLNGTLKEKPKVKLSSDEKVSVKIKRLQDNIKHWETKLKRTNTYLKSYKGKLKRYKKLYPHL
jgi:predicted DNA-binding antitoxin AbrB/MazE fold protein